MRLWLYIDVTISEGVAVYLSSLSLGDNPPHDMWNETYESQLLATKVVVNSVSEKLGATLIYPALGNHGKS